MMRNSDTEIGIAYNDNREVLWIRYGDENVIPVTSDDITLLRGLHFAHNHPKNASFSQNDLELAERIGLKSIEVIRREGGDLRIDYLN